MTVVRKRGFTLIELLVVIAIIAILAAILFPVFAKAQRSAKRTTCINNMKQIGVALMQYSSDHNEKLPPTWYYLDNSLRKGGNRGWMNNVMQYSRTEDVMKCPETTRYQWSYCRNEWAGEQTVASSKDPSRTIHIFDLPRYPLRGYDNRFQTNLETVDDSDWSNDWQYRVGDTDEVMVRKTSIIMGQPEGSPYWLRFSYNSGNTSYGGVHDGKTVILFADSHVATFSGWDPNKMVMRWGKLASPKYLTR